MLQRSNRRLDRRPGFPVLSRFPVRETGCCIATKAVDSSLRAVTSGNEFPWSRPAAPNRGFLPDRAC